METICFNSFMIRSHFVLKKLPTVNRGKKNNENYMRCRRLKRNSQPNPYPLPHTNSYGIMLL